MKLKKFFPLAGILVLWNAAAWCADDSEAAAGPAIANPAVLVQHDGVQVTVEDLRAELQRIPEGYRSSVLQNPDRLRPLVASLFVMKQLASEARAADMASDPLVQRRMELAATRQLAEIYLDDLIAREQQPDFEALAREQYLAGSERYQTPERIKASHILISTENRTDEEALARAREVLEKLEGDETTFLKVAAEYSDDPGSARSGGSLGYFSRGQMAEPFEEAAFAMEPGETSEPVKSRFGYHIIRLEDRRSPGKMAFEDVKTELVENIKKQHEQRVRQQQLGRVRSLENIQTNHPVLESIIAEGKLPDAQ